MTSFKKLLISVQVTGLFNILSLIAAGCTSNNIGADIQSTGSIQTQTAAPTSSANVESETPTNTTAQTEVMASTKPYDSETDAPSQITVIASPSSNDTKSECAVSDKSNQNINEDINSLIYLKDGNTKKLVGLTFGDEFNYNLFDSCGSADESYIYLLKNSTDDGLRYFFNGRGNRFSGLTAYGGSGNFFGINIGSDTIEKVINVLGEPNELKTASDYGVDSCATYLFNTATLEIYTNENSYMYPRGAIIHVE